jgi:Heat shock protein
MNTGRLWPACRWHYFLYSLGMKTHIIILALGLLACNNQAGSEQPAGDSTAAPLIDTPEEGPPAAADTSIQDTTSLTGTWFLQPVLSSDTATGKIPRLQFNLNTKQFTGHTGCNNMSGTFEFTDSSLVFNKGIRMTKMACVGYNEKAFLENLLRTDRYHLENGMLILLFGETELSRWTRKVTPKPVSNKT